MAVAGVGPNYLKAVAALAAALPVLWLGAGGAFLLLQRLGVPLPGEPDQHDLLYVALGLIPMAVVFGLALRLGPGAALPVRIGFGLWAGLWALLLIVTNLFGSLEATHGPIFWLGPAVVIGTFLAWLGRPRRVSAGRVAASALLIWLAVWLTLLLQAFQVVPQDWLPGLMLALPLTLFFLPLARMEIAE